MLFHGSSIRGRSVVFRGTEDGKIWQSILPEALQFAARFSILKIEVLESDAVLLIGVGKDEKAVIFRSDDQIVLSSLDRNITSARIKAFVDQHKSADFMRNYKNKAAS